MAFRCMECGRRFKTTRAAERAANNGCPGCGGVDIDLDAGDPPAGRELPPGYRREAGVVVGSDGRAVCPGVVCRCDEGVVTCPMHGRKRE